MFRTEVEVKRADSLISYDSRLLFMGSCFATNMGRYFEHSCLNVQVNPFGVLYNPFSIAASIERMIRQDNFTEADVKLHNDSYHTFYHHSQFNHPDKAELLKQINESLSLSSDSIRRSDVLIITFGTSWVYEHKELEMVVSNCHKYPSRLFHRYRLSVDVIVERYRKLLKALHDLNPKLRVIFTVSPVRHWKDGAHGNQLSKATLLLAIEQLCSHANFVSYFPAYELLLDDLRDYRFFADDMLHPSVKAVEYIRNKFIESQFDASAKEVLKQLSKLIRAANHRPFNTASDAHQAFVKQHLEKVKAMQQQYPELNLAAVSTTFLKQLI